MNTITSITNNSFNSKSWRSCLRLLLALVLLGCGATAKAQNSDVWTNGTGNNNWSITNNWIVNGNPALGLTNNGGDNLIFPQMVPDANATYRSTNNFPAGLVTIGSITFNTNGYVLGGNALFITNGIIDNYGSNTIALPFTLLGSQTWQNTVNPVGQTNTQTTLVQPLNMGIGNNTLTFSGGGNFNLDGTGGTASEVVGGTNGGGMIVVNNPGGTVRLGPRAGSTGNFFGSNWVNAVTLTTNAFYNTNTFLFTNVVIFATNTVFTNVVYIPVTNSANSYASGFSYVVSNNVYTFSTNTQYVVKDVVEVDAGTLQAGSVAAPYIPTGASVGNVSVDGTWDLNGYGPTINGLEDQNTGLGIVDNVGTTLTGTYTLTIGNASSNGIFSGVIRNSSGSVALNKTGFGTEVLMNGNQYSGQTTISQGMLMLSNNPVTSTVGSLGASSTQLTILSGAVFDMSALNAYGGYIPPGALTVSAGTPGKPYTNFYGSYLPYSPATPNYVVTISSTNTVVTSVISNAYTSGGSFIGSFTNFTTNYTTIVYATNSIVNVINYDVVGNFTVNGGGAISPIASASYASSPASVSPTAVPGIATWSINGALVIDSSRTLPTVVPNRVNFLLNNVTTPGGGTNDLIAVNGPLYIGDELDVAVTALTGTLVSGGGQKYTLFTASGGYTATGGNASNGDGDVNAANIVPIAPRGITATITSDANNVYLAASGTVAPGQIIWRGTPSANNWDVKLTQNWVTNAPSQLPDYYYAGDNLTFDDTGVGSINLPVVQAPSSMTFNNNNTNYSFVANSGTFVSGSGTLTLNGRGTVTLNNPNSFTGDITINNGTLIAGNYGGFNATLLYNGVTPGKIIFGNGGNNEIFLHNWNIVNTSQGGFLSGFTLNSGANAQIGTLNARASNVTEYLVVGDNITRQVGSSIYFSYGIRSGSLSTIYFTNSIPWVNNVMFPGYGHTGTDWVAGQTNYPANAVASYNYAGYSNNPASTGIWVATNNIVVSNNTAQTLTAGATINTLKLQGPATLTISAGQILTNATGGLLVSSASTGPSTILGGTIVGALGADLVVLQNYLTSPLYIGSVIADNSGTPTALTIGGLGGTVIITNTATYSGATYLNNGTLQIGNGTPLGSIASSSAIHDNGILTYKLPSAVSQSFLDGVGSLTQAGTGALTLTADNSLSGIVTVSSGILQLGNGGSAGSVSNAASLVDNSMLVVNNNASTGYPNPISGSGDVVNGGTGVFVITTNETYTGNTIVSNGTIKLMPSASISNTASIIVKSGAALNIDPGTLTLRGTLPTETLSGDGTVMGSITTVGGTSITPGTNGVVGNLTITNDLNFNSGYLVMDVGTNGNDHIYIGGKFNENSGLVKVLLVNTLTNGVYRLVSATNGLNGTTAANLAVYVPGIPNGTLAVLTNATANSLDLLVYSGFSTSVFWKGDGTQNFWNGGPSSIWRNSGGTVVQYANADIVTFDDFGSNNIPVSLNSASVFPSAVIVNSTNENYIIGDGTAPNAGNIISGGASLTKNGAGTLTLQTLNDFLGVAVINAGTVQLNDAGTSSSADGMLGGLNSVTNNGTLIANNATNETLAGALVGSGLLVQQGAGKLTLAGDNSQFSGPVSITNSLQVGNGLTGALGTGPITNNGTLIMDVNGNASVPVNISGSGSVSNIAGTVTLSGNNTYGGATAVNGGRLKVGSATAIPVTTSLIMNDNSNGLSSVGTLDLNGTSITVANLLGGNTGQATAAIAPAIILNNGATTNLIVINGGGTNTFYGQIKDNDNHGNITGPGFGAVGLVIIGGDMTLAAPYNGTSVSNNVFGGGSSGPGITISNAVLRAGGAAAGNYGGSGGTYGTACIGGNPIGTQNLFFVGTNDAYYAAASVPGNQNPTLATLAGVINVPTNTTVSMFGAQRGQLGCGTLTGSGTIFYYPEYVRDRLNFGVATNFYGKIIFTGYAPLASAAVGAVFGYDGTIGFPNADVVFATNNPTFTELYPTTASTQSVLGFGSLSGGDNTAALAGSSGNAGANVVYCIGTLNRDTVYGGQIFDGVSIRKLGTGTLTLTNNVLSYTGQTVVSNGTLAFAPSGNIGTFFGTLGFNPLTNNFLVASNYTIVSPGVLDLTQVPTNTLFLGHVVSGASVTTESLFGNGTLNGNVFVTNSVVAPGRHAGMTNLSNAGSVAYFPGSLTVKSNAVFGTNSTIVMSYSTNTPVGYDNLNVLGTLTIQQAALVVVSNGPTAFPLQAMPTTNVFCFFSNSVNVALGLTSGGITNITVPPLPPGMIWRTNLNGTLAGYPTIPAGSMAIINNNLIPASTNALLTGLVVAPAGTLSPAFTSNTFSYTAVEAYTGTPITASPTNWDTTATNTVIYLGATQTVASAAASTPLALGANPLSNNVVRVHVIAQDDVHVADYTVTVTRHPDLTPGPLAPVVNNNVMTMNWPLSENGYKLQAQTNALGIGLSNNWVNVANTELTNNITIIIDSNQPSVFYRLINTNSP